MLGTENYNTSFQSLMGPMYNVNANYSAYGMGAGAYGMGNGLGFGSGYMGGLMTPMANVGVGQFNGDYLIKDDSKNNNYYARPVAVHKKIDETGTILGILGTALGTAALLAALCKGKRPASLPTPPAPGRRTYVPPTTTPIITDPTRMLPSPSTVTKMPASGYVAGVTIPGRTGAILDLHSKAVKPGTMFGSTPVATQGISGYLPSPQTVSTNFPSARQVAAQSKLNAAQNMPSSGITFEMPGQVQNKVASGNFNVSPLTPEQATRLGIMTPEAQAAYNNVLGRQFRPGVEKNARRLDAQIAFSQMPKTTNNAVDDFVRPVVTRKNNRFANVSGQLYQAKFAPYGLGVDTQAFARLTKNLHREFNNVVVNGTEMQLKNITCDPRFEGIFHVV